MDKLPVIDEGFWGGLFDGGAWRNPAKAPGQASIPFWILAFRLQLAGSFDKSFVWRSDIVNFNMISRGTFASWQWRANRLQQQKGTNISSVPSLIGSANSSELAILRPELTHEAFPMHRSSTRSKIMSPTAKMSSRLCEVSRRWYRKPSPANWGNPLPSQGQLVQRTDNDKVCLGSISSWKWIYNGAWLAWRRKSPTFRKL